MSITNNPLAAISAMMIAINDMSIVFLLSLTYYISNRH